MATYRPNVAAILRKPKSGKILICKRNDFSKNWQFPQGGVDDGEDLLGALFREVEEEIGVPREMLSLHSCRTGYRYKFPNGNLKNGVYCGQDQTYFLCDFLGKNKDIILDQKEFSGVRWIQPADFQLAWIPAFKHKVFRRVFKDFFGVRLKKVKVT